MPNGRKFAYCCNNKRTFDHLALRNAMLCNNYYNSNNNITRIVYVLSSQL